MDDNESDHGRSSIVRMPATMVQNRCFSSYYRRLIRVHKNGIRPDLSAQKTVYVQTLVCEKLASCRVLSVFSRASFDSSKKIQTCFARASSGVFSRPTPNSLFFRTKTLTSNSLKYNV
jgi:hypothetical protein